MKYAVRRHVLRDIDWQSLAIDIAMEQINNSQQQETDTNPNVTTSKTSVPMNTLNFVWNSLYKENGKQYSKKDIKDTKIGDVVDSLKKVLGLKTNDVLDLLDDITYSSSGYLEWVGNPSEDTLGIIQKFMTGQISTYEEAEAEILEKISKQLCNVCTSCNKKCNKSKTSCKSTKSKKCKKCCGGCCGKSKQCNKKTCSGCCGGCNGQKSAESPITDGIDGASGIFASSLNKLLDRKPSDQMFSISKTLDMVSDVLAPLFNSIFGMTWSENLKWIPNSYFQGMADGMSGAMGGVFRGIDADYRVVDSTADSTNNKKKKNKCKGGKCKGGKCGGCCNKAKKCCGCCKKWMEPDEKIPEYFDFLQQWFNGTINQVADGIFDMCRQVLNISNDMMASAQGVV